MNGSAATTLPAPPRHIVVYGRRWFQSLYGNTYHSVTVYVDGERLGYVPFEYGYGDQYLQTAMELLVKAGIYERDDEHGYIRTLSQAARQAGDTLIYQCSDVQRRRDLKQLP